MAIFTSKATGNWSASGQTTWNEVGVPGPGDSATINSPHTATVDIDTTAGDNTDSAIVINSGATLVVAASVTLTVTGNIDNAGSIDLGAGAAIFERASFYRSLTVDHTQVPSDQTDFPVLVYISDATFKDISNGGHVIDGSSDIVFFSDSRLSTQLHSEIDFYDNVNGILWAWVKLPTVSSSVDTIFYVAYGVTTSRLTNPWNSNYIGVWHLPNGTTLGALDSTANGLNGSIGSAVVAATGKINGAASFNASTPNSFINVPYNAAMDSTNITLAAWIKTSTRGPSMVIADREAGSVPRIFQFTITPDGGVVRLFFIPFIGGNTHQLEGSTEIGDGNWHYCVGTYDGTTIRVYVDGNADGTLSVSGTLAIGSRDLVFGCSNNFVNQPLTGQLDELKYLSAAMTADWIKTEYNNQSNPGTFLSLGVENIRSQIVPSAATITLTGGVSPLSIGLASTPASLVLTGLTSIVSRTLLPAPATLTLTGATSTLLLFSTISPQSYTKVRFTGGPALIGTSPAPGPGGSGRFSSYTIFVNKVDRTNNIFVGAPTGPGIQINKQINSRRTCTFTAYDKGTGYYPNADDPVEIYEHGTSLIFKGSIDSSQQHSYPRSTKLDTQVSCTDLGIVCDRRVVGKFYIPLFFPTVDNIVSDIVQTALAGTGITYFGDGTVDGLNETGITFFYVTVTEALNSLASLINCDWDIDVHGVLRLFTPIDGYTDAPASFTDSSNNWDDMRVIRTRAYFGNKIYAKSSINLGNIWMDSKVASAANLFGMAFLTSYPLTVTPIVKVGGVDVVVIPMSGIPASGGAFDYYYVDPGGIGVFRNWLLPPLAGGTTVDILYPAPLPFVGIAEDDTSIASVGEFDLAVEAGAIDDQQQLQAIAVAELARGVERPVQVEIDTRTTGFEPGMRMTVNSTHPPVNDLFIVESVTMQEADQNFFRTTVKGSNRAFQRAASPASYLGTIIARTRIPADRITETLSFTVAGTIEGQTNPGLTTGLKTALRVAEKKGSIGWVTITFPTAAVALAEIKVFQNGVSIFGTVNLLLLPGELTHKQWILSTIPLKSMPGDQYTFNVLQADATLKDGTLNVFILG